jgi:hypothetical protein
MTSTLGQAAPVTAASVTAPSRRPSLPRPRRSVRTTAIVGVACALAVAVTLVLTLPGSSEPKAERFASPSSYHVTYAITTPHSGESTEQLWVRRPFDSVDITYDGAPPGATPSLVAVYRLGVQVLKAANAQAALLHIPAGAAPQDVRADVVVPAALRAHKVKVVGHAQVLGRSCQVFRSAVPLRAGPLPTQRSHSTYVDTCIDPAGIVLRETQVSAGHTMSDRRAVLVQTGDSAVVGASFDMTGTPTPFDSGGGAFTPLTLTSRPPGSSWALEQPPAGFQHVGRFAVVPPQPQLFGQGGNGFGSMGLPGGLVTEMDDVFVRGADFLVLQQGSTLNGAAFRPPANGLGVDLGRLGRGQLLIAGNGTTIVAEPGNGKGFVRLSGALPTDELVGLMRGLSKQPGGTLTRLQGKAG